MLNVIESANRVGLEESISSVLAITDPAVRFREPRFLAIYERERQRGACAHDCRCFSRSSPAYQSDANDCQSKRKRCSDDPHDRLHPRRCVIRTLGPVSRCECEVLHTASNLIIGHKALRIGFSIIQKVFCSRSRTTTASLVESSWSLEIVFLRNVARILTSKTCRPETGLAGRPVRLRGWACRTRTGESVGELSDWNCAATSPEIGARAAAETPSRG
jgi:hypothetical protein